MFGIGAKVEENLMGLSWISQYRVIGLEILDNRNGGGQGGTE
jgi:hypothetical protein